MPRRNILSLWSLNVAGCGLASGLRRAVRLGAPFSADLEIGIPKVVYAQGVQVPDAVKNECQLSEKVSECLLHDANVKVADKPNEGRYLDMSITEVFAAASGAWAGPPRATSAT
jgi:hypothetical protein